MPVCYHLVIARSHPTPPIYVPTNSPLTAMLVAPLPINLVSCHHQSLLDATSCHPTIVFSKPMTLSPSRLHKHRLAIICTMLRMIATSGSFPIGCHQLTTGDPFIVGAYCRQRCQSCYLTKIVLLPVNCLAIAMIVGSLQAHPSIAVHRQPTQSPPPQITAHHHATIIRTIGQEDLLQCSVPSLRAQLTSYLLLYHRLSHNHQPPPSHYATTTIHAKPLYRATMPCS